MIPLMKKTLLLMWAALTIGLAAVSCSGDDTPGPGNNSETALDPEIIPEQDTDPYPGESADYPFEVSNAIGDDMVVQQNKVFNVWGRGTTGQTVSVTVSWSSRQFSSTVNGRGFWRVRINVPPVPAGQPDQSMVVKCGDKKFAYRGIQIGEVWVCSGQSNMQMSICGVPGAENQEAVVAESANYSKVRMYTSHLFSSDTPQWNCTGTGWNKMSPEFARDFYCSAVAYFFGKTLFDKLNVPIGLIVNSYGGAVGQTYVSTAALDADPVLKARYMDPYRANPSAYVAPTIPGGLYNSMVYPFFNASVRGMVWYQGESNWGDWDTYPRLMQCMVTEWRSGFGQGDFPHYYVQVAGTYWHYTGAERLAFWDQYSWIRYGQEQIRGLIDNCEMVTTLDVGDPDDVHPVKKREVGERLAWVALNRQYRRSDIVCLGPRYKSHEISGNTVTVTFDHANGLRTSDGGTPKYFYIAGADKVFYLASATVDGNKVRLTNPSVDTPVAVRYAFISAPLTNLENSHRLPAEQFRTDRWDKVTYNPSDMKTEKPY